MEKPVNLLSIDGGGVRGVSALLVLDEIMRRIQYDSQRSELPRPCEFFQLIGGTSTGGLIALMLGRLRMTTDQALRAYNTIAEAVFSKKNRKPFHKDGTFKATTLETKVKEIVGKNGSGQKMLVTADDDLQARAFVCAIPADDWTKPRLFRTYQVRENASFDCTIWEACRATIAAPTFFKRITIGDEGSIKEDFLDGGLKFNNPTELVIEEGRTVFGDECRVGCVVSLGNGHPGTISLAQPDAFQRMLPLDLVDVLKRMATNCEETAETLASRFRDAPDHYFRFSVDQGVGQISLEEWKKMKEIKAHTHAYLKQVAISASVNRVVAILTGSADGPARSVSLRALGGILPPPTDASTLPQARTRPICTSLFLGREDVLLRLDQCFSAREQGPHPRREFLLWGTGGAGKSQIALKFLEGIEDRFSIFWADASSSAALEQSYRDIARSIDASLDEKCTTIVAMRRLASLRSDWLLLFDGADDLDAMTDLFPPGVTGNVLYTSRNPMLRRLPSDQRHEVGEMAPAQATDLLLQASHALERPETRQIADSIVNELGYLALAIDQAGAYIAHGECELADFEERFKQHRMTLMSNDAWKKASANDRAVYATWDLSYSAISRQASEAGHQGRGDARSALYLLQIFACLHHENVPKELFKKAVENASNSTRGIATAELSSDADDDRVFSAPSGLMDTTKDGKWNDLAFGRGIRILLSCSLIRRGGSIELFSMHKLVHAWAADQLSLPQKASCQLLTSHLVEHSISWGYSKDDYDFRAAISQHVLALVESAEAIQTEFGVEQSVKIALVLSEAGLFTKVARLQEQVLEATTRTLGEEHPDTLTSRGNLASTYRHQGRLEDAARLHKQVVEAIIRTLGEEHPNTLTSRSNLASTYWHQGRLEDAARLHEQVVEVRTRTLGEEHPDTLTSRGNLASTYWHQGRWDEAEKLDLHY